MFDVTTLWEEGSWTLKNRRVFAHCDKGFPDGIKCDVLGNVYSGCGDGVHVFPLHTSQTESHISSLVSISTNSSDVSIDCSWFLHLLPYSTKAILFQSRAHIHRASFNSFLFGSFQID